MEPLPIPCPANRHRVEHVERSRRAVRAFGDQRCIHPELDVAGGGLPRWLT